jgi:pyridoxine/pyridoxamine 5'-phosphate oxidase
VYLKNKFSRKSEANIKEGVFAGPQIRELIQDVKFKDQLSEVKKKYGNHPKMALPIFWEIKRVKTEVIWWLLL